jgi:hypothetical protein
MMTIGNAPTYASATLVTGKLRIAGSHACSMLLVPHENVSDLLLSVESVVNSDCMAARHTKDELHALRLENVNDGLAATLHHH